MRNLSDVQSLVIDPSRLGRALVRRLRPLFGLNDESPVLPKSRIGPWIKLLYGAWVHMRTGETPQSAHLALIALFIRSGGRANDLLSRAVGILHPPYRLPRPSGVLGDLSTNDLAKIENQLETDGYYVFENCLSAEFCERVIQQTLATDCVLAGDEITQERPGNRARYDRDAPTAALYQLTRDDTTDLAEVQELVSDPSIIAVAQNYLKSKPIFTGIVMRWSPAIKNTPDSEAAQEFHWDMERIKWIRFFIYLTDVTVDSGPHCFIKGTHRTGAIPEDLLRQGYVRQKDEILLQRYGNEAYLEFTGPRGTIVAEDSRGWHKGKPPRKGDRLLLAFELCNTTFGANKRHLIRNIRVPRFGEFAVKYPRLYANFDFAPGVLH
jgi:ectoine hydroxylase-related dioxygenase (phytanoyl-CoA dioxygenase family)